MIELIKIAALEAVKNLKACDVLFGTVISVDPLQIKADSDDKLVLKEKSLILSRNVTDHQTWFSFDDENIKQRIKIYDKPEDEPVIAPSEPEPEEERETDIQFVWTDYRKGFNLESPDGQMNEEEGKQATKHLITVYNHLMLNERVILIRQEGGQRFVVIDRIG